jgi:uncharacterized protein YxjI
MTRRMSFNAASYHIQLPGDFLKVKGDIWNQAFTCYRAATGAVVANVTREYFAWDGAFAVEISPTENVPLFLACVIVLEHEENHRRHT